jgi:hypothetical protein
VAEANRHDGSSLWPKGVTIHPGSSPKSTITRSQPLGPLPSPKYRSRPGRGSGLRSSGCVIVSMMARSNRAISGCSSRMCAHCSSRKTTVRPSGSMTLALTPWPAILSTGGEAYGCRMSSWSRFCTKTVSPSTAKPVARPASLANPPLCGEALRRPIPPTTLNA